MRATLILDSLGPNPAFEPPVRRDFATDEDFADAKALYDVPRDLCVKAGTEISGELCWIHCFPDQHGVAFRYDSSGKVIPYRKAPGIVRAVPADPACEREFALRAAASAASRGVAVKVVLDEVAAGVARSQALQLQTNPAPAPAPVPRAKDAA